MQHSSQFAGNVACCRMPMTLYSLFWCMFGQVGTDSVIITYPAKPSSHSSETSAHLFSTSAGGRLAGDGATSIVESVGLLLFALYHVTVIIVLVNMLIAMMSHSFEDIQVSQQTIALFKSRHTDRLSVSRASDFSVNVTYKHISRLILLFADFVERSYVISASC